MKEIRWLHFTDLHVGCNSYDWMWPNYKDQLIDDLRVQYTLNGPWDVVFFTGDLTFSGTQFDAFEDVLVHLWKNFEELGCNPILFVVPGNHDIVRPDEHNPVAKVLNNWKNESYIQELYWNDDNNDYNAFTLNLFANFEKWQKISKINKPEVLYGLLPGDFSAKLLINEIELGVVGLNTASLHYNDKVDTNSLIMHPKQFYKLMPSNYSEWFKNNDFSVLMTHHDSNCLDEISRNHYNSLINPSDRFSVHLCGHLHNSQSLHSSESGASPRFILKGPALFGLNKWNNEYERTLGYTAGKFIKDGESKIVRFWPRKLIKKNAGNFKIEVDQGYDLLNDSVSIYIKKQLNIELLPLDVLTDAEGGGFQEIYDKPLKLNRIPRFSIYDEKQHQSVRMQEINVLMTALIESKGAWITADWGLGKEGFVRSVLSKLRKELNISETAVYIMVPCDEIDSVDDLLCTIEDYCNMTIQNLCHALNDKPLFIIFDNVPSEMVNKTNIKLIENLFDTIIDFSDNYYVIGITRLKLSYTKYININLTPLDLPDVRTYIELHPSNSLDIIDGEYVDRLHTLTQGFPLYIDLFLKLLEVSSFDDLIDLDYDFAIKEIETEERIPSALKVAVNSLANSIDEYTIRSYKLLKVLSVLANGETFTRIKRLYNSKPFHPINVTTLVDLSLIDVLPIYTQTKDISPDSKPVTNVNIDKLLRVPRQVRDYIRSLLSDEELLEIVKTSADLLFGTNWRQGNIKMASSSFFKSHGVKPIELGNEHIVAKSLMWHSIKYNNMRLLTQATLLGMSYCNLLFEEDRFKDSMLASEELCHFLSDIDDKTDLLKFKLILARSLRMMSKYEEALLIFKTLEENPGNIFTKVDMASIYLNIALIKEKQAEYDDAIAAARNAQKTSKKSSPIYNQSTAIILKNNNTINDRDIKLHQLEVNARRKKQFSVANNICIDFSRNIDGEGKLTLLDTVINSQGTDYYNKIIAIVYKLYYLASPTKVELVTNKDCLNISIAYTYLYSQRFSSLFNKCHDAIWNLLYINSQNDKLLKLYMHSSFLWRIRGDHKKEMQYLVELQKIPITLFDCSTNEYRYFRNRIINLNTKNIN